MPSMWIWKGFQSAVSISGGCPGSRMRELSEGLIRLGHVPSSIFHNLLQFSFHQRFTVPKEELADTIQVANYLLAEAFLSECLSVLAEGLTPENCLPYLGLAEDISCAKLRTTVFTYLSRNLLEQSHLTRGVSPEEMEELIGLRAQGRRRGLCVLRKVNILSRDVPETARARRLFRLSEDGGDSSWHPISELPFRADIWCYTAVVLFNYLYILGGCTSAVSTCFNAIGVQSMTDAVCCVPQHRRHFSAVACDGGIYAVGGRYLDSLVSPDSQHSPVHRRGALRPLRRLLEVCVFTSSIWFPVHSVYVPRRSPGNQLRSLCLCAGQHPENRRETTSAVQHDRRGG
ncbi:unnamed protein product [Arctogadus glacialis]